jgi:hypothetical protein
VLTTGTTRAGGVRVRDVPEHTRTGEVRPVVAPGRRSEQPGRVSRSGTSVGTVVRWDEEAHGAVIEVPGLPGDCWADATVVEHDTVEGTLRAGQVVTVQWVEDGAGRRPFRAVHVRRRRDQQATPGA